MRHARFLLSIVGLITSFSVITSAYSAIPLPRRLYIEANGGGTQIFNRKPSGTAPGVTVDNSSASAGNVNLGYKIIMPYLGIEVGGTWFSGADIFGPTQFPPNVPPPPPNLLNQKIGTVSTWSYGLALRGVLPLGCGLELFGKVGAQQLNSLIEVSKISVPTNPNPNGNDVVVNTGDNSTIVQENNNNTQQFVEIPNPLAAQLGLRHKTYTKVAGWYGVGAQYFFIPEMAGLAEWQRFCGSKQTGSFNLFSLGFTFIVY